jgi:ppGpp synthetase/RelA/SpoT-type nucleotidyltranferase
MDLEQTPGWSKRRLNGLGEALVIDKAVNSDGCPQYGEVMLWHNDLASEVAARIANAPWDAMPSDQLSISARAKTVDTIVQKLQRTTLKLGQVQDLAGVRLDADMVLTQQTDLAQEIAEHFGAARATIKDIRAKPHSGYRGLHVWLTLPAGRVEVQIRTTIQSEWANTYEGIAEFFGRGIRYGEAQEDAHIRDMVNRMYRWSTTLSTAEEIFDRKWRFERLPRRVRRRSGQVGAATKQWAGLHTKLVECRDEALAMLGEMQCATREFPGAKYSDIQGLNLDEGV